MYVCFQELFNLMICQSLHNSDIARMKTLSSSDEIKRQYVSNIFMWKLLENSNIHTQYFSYIKNNKKIFSFQSAFFF